MFNLFKKKPPPEPKPITLTDYEVTFEFQDGTSVTVECKSTYFPTSFGIVDISADKVLENTIEHWKKKEWYPFKGRLYNYYKLKGATIASKNRTIMV